MRDPLLVGLDECGVGELAGPLIACAFTCPDSFLPVLSELDCRDSKTTNHHLRKTIYKALKRYRKRGKIDFQVVMESAETINRQGVWYTKADAAKKVLTLVWGQAKQGIVFLDGQETIDLALPGMEQIAQPGADAHNPRVATASIIAKYTLDCYWAAVNEQYPDWRFFEHHGNASHRHHLAMLRAYGPLPGIHRQGPLNSLFKTLAKGGGPHFATQP